MEAVPGVGIVEDVVIVAGEPIRLVRPTSANEVFDLALERGAVDAPYWADLWPAARGLADHLAGRDLAGLRTIELGCGLGLPALAAARAGADVLATDMDADALRLVSESASRNGLLLRTALLELGDEARVAALAEPPFDLVLAADVLYAVDLAPLVAAAIVRLLAPGGEAIVAYPYVGQADRIGEALAAAGLDVDEEAVPAEGRRGPTVIRLLRATASAVV